MNKKYTTSVNKCTARPRSQRLQTIGGSCVIIKNLGINGEAQATPIDLSMSATSSRAVANKVIKAYADKVAQEAEDAAIRGALEGLSADEIYIKYIENKMSLLLAQDGGLGTPEGMQGLGIVSIPSAEIITDALGYEPNKSFIHIQGEASDVWMIEHNMGRYPSVTVVDSAGSAVFGDVTYTNENQLTVTFSVAFSGKAFLN